MTAGGGERAVERTLSAFALAAFVALVGLALAGFLSTGRWDAADPAILLRVRAWTGGTGWPTALAEGITALGNDVTLWIVTLLAGGWLLAARRGGDVSQLLVVAAGGGALTSAIKHVVARPRPTVVHQLVATHSASFPSGHAMNSAFVYGTLALLAAGAVGTVRERVYLAAAAVALVTCIGISRIVLGVHWPTDVLAGWAIGSAWAVVASICRTGVRSSGA